jgi:hypothetical protein
MIPSSNVQNLMLKDEVIEAVQENIFKIWAIDTIDDGIEVLTGVKAGSIEEEGTIHCLINNTLDEFSETMKEFIEELAHIDPFLDSILFRKELEPREVTSFTIRKKLLERRETQIVSLSELISMHSDILLKVVHI